MLPHTKRYGYLYHGGYCCVKRKSLDIANVFTEITLTLLIKVGILYPLKLLISTLL